MVGFRFLPLSARYAVRKLRRDGPHYGFTLVDAYCGKGVPDELTTVEFFRDVLAVSDHVAANIIMDRDLESEFAHNILASVREAWGDVAVFENDTAILTGSPFLTLPGARVSGETGIVYDRLHHVLRVQGRPQTLATVPVNGSNLPGFLAPPGKSPR